MTREMHTISSDKRKNQLINLLINNGIYKKDGRHLYDLSTPDLEKTWHSIKSPFNVS